jgi:hypothetical protein
MVTSMTPTMRRIRTKVARYLDDRIVRWRTGAPEGQAAVFAVLASMSLLLLVGSMINYDIVPAAAFVVPMLFGSMALRYWPLLWLVVVNLACLFVAVGYAYWGADEGELAITEARVTTVGVMVLVGAIVVFESSRHRSGLPASLGEAMLVDLRDKLQAQGVVPPLPDGWSSQSAILSAGGARFAGDFLVANLSDDDSVLEMVLVDVCGKGVGAGTQALQFAGALGGLIGALEPKALIQAGNEFLLRQNWDDGFATAVHVRIDLTTGDFSIVNAGHPPVLCWSQGQQRWSVDTARGLALGITHDANFHQTVGRLAPGDALMFYTDGVVESRRQDLTSGIERLRAEATEVVAESFDNAAKRLLGRVAQTDDDRAMLIVHRNSTN